jgi:hypothetical protein
VTSSSQDLACVDIRRPVQPVLLQAKQSHWKAAVTYFIGCLSTVIGCYAALLCALLFLRATGNLPPPIVTNNLCFDEKLQWMSHELPSSPPDLLVFGSSVAWRHFDGRQAIESGVAKNPYNLGFCGMRLSQTAFLIKYFLNKRQFQFPARVIIIASPLDFEGCSSPEEQVFSKKEADDTIFSRRPNWELYLKNTEPVPLVRNARVIKTMRAGAIDPMLFTKYGDGPLDLSSRGLLYGPIKMFRQNCFVALGNLGRWLSEREIQTTLVLTPLHPQWLSKYDPNRRVLNELRSRLSEALNNANVHVWDASEDNSFAESDFIDAVHLRWSAVARLTTEIAVR